MTELVADRELDLRGEVCPFTFVKAKLALEDMETGQVLRIVLDHPPASENVPNSLRTTGEDVLGVRRLDGPTWEILVRKAT